jgi:DNA modification methylase
MLTKSQKYYFDKSILESIAADGAKGANHARNVWSIPTAHVQGHIAPFPRMLALLCILSSCPLDGIVLDPFAGSGTVLSVAQEYGRNAIGIELNQPAVNLCIESVRQLPLPLPGLKVRA